MDDNPHYAADVQTESDPSETSSEESLPETGPSDGVLPIPDKVDSTQATVLDEPPAEERSPQPAGGKPFVVTLHGIRSSSRGPYTPWATIELSPSLRHSGLLAALSGEELKSIVALLTFLTPNGDIQTTVPELAAALQQSEAKVKDRLKQLSRFRWHGTAMVASWWRENGLDAYTITPAFISYREAITAPDPATAHPADHIAGRDAVLEQSRARYTRPRLEVERQIAMAQGWPLPGDENTGGAGASTSDVSPEENLRERLLRLGVTAEQAEVLTATFPPEEIEAQIAWLPYRGAKNPASYLVAAITRRYAEPGLLKLRREMDSKSEIGAGMGAPTQRT